MGGPFERKGSGSSTARGRAYSEERAAGSQDSTDSQKHPWLKAGDRPGYSRKCLSPSPAGAGHTIVDLHAPHQGHHKAACSCQQDEMTVLPCNCGCSACRCQHLKRAILPHQGRSAAQPKSRFQTQHHSLAWHHMPCRACKKQPCVQGPRRGCASLAVGNSTRCAAEGDPDSCPWGCSSRRVAGSGIAHPQAIAHP